MVLDSRAVSYDEGRLTHLLEVLVPGTRVARKLASGDIHTKALPERT